MVEFLLSKKGRKAGAWIWLLAGLVSFLASSLTHKDIPPGAITLYCFVWGVITGHSIAEHMKRPESGNGPA